MKNFSFILILPSSEKRKKIFLDKHILYLCNFCHCSAHPPHALPSWFFPCRLLRTRILLGGCTTRFLAGSWHIGQSWYIKSLIYLGVRFRSSPETSILMIMIKLTFLLLLKTYEMSCLCNSSFLRPFKHPTALQKIPPSQERSVRLFISSFLCEGFKCSAIL